MIEFALVLGVNGFGLIFAIVLARWLVARDAGGAELRRLGNALERAVQGFIWGGLKRVLLALLLVSALCFTLYGFLPGKGVGRVDAGLWALMGALLGGLAASVTAYAAAHVAHKGSVRCVAASRLSLDRSLSIAMRAGGVAGLLTETVAAISVGAFAALIAGLRGAFKLTGDTSWVASVSALLPTIALGAGTAGLLLQRGGSIFHAAGDAGGDLTSNRVAGLDDDDTRNPAMVADLVGDHVGLVVGRTLTTFVAACASHVAMLVVGLWVYEKNLTSVPGALGLALLPLLVRAFGVFASSIGLLVVRTNEGAVPRGALMRGQLVSWLIALSGIVGASYWLAQGEWWRFASAGALGLCASTGVAQLVGFLQERARGNPRDNNEALRDGASALIIHGVSRGSGAALVPLAVLGVGVTAAHYIGSKSTITEAGSLSLLVCVAAILVPSPYLLALATFAPIADNARGVASLSRSGSTDVERRTEALDQAGFVSLRAASTHMLLAGGSGVLLGVLAAPCLAGLGSTLTLAHPAVIWAGMLGAALVLFYSSGTMGRAERAARALGKEVERQLRSVPRGNSNSIARDFTPAYKACIDLAGKNALERLARPALLGLAVPLLLGLALRRLYGTADGSIAMQALIAFLVLATGTGLVLALAADATKYTLGGLRRATRNKSTGETRSASVGGDAFADVLANVGGSAAFLFTLSAAAVVLVAAPFLN
ncbi:MAG: sodium/proton-translocating pyrophosphatase [Polyangiaceae bacterium]|nr:sodium/proton-translocating pyrophosphatase [Polyangiaceae bacterium]MCB9605130.1 sodium/proton-translocating pyrophosphatase [Polyangiaceae bacterium]